MKQIKVNKIPVKLYSSTERNKTMKLKTNKILGILFSLLLLSVGLIIAGCSSLAESAPEQANQEIEPQADDLKIPEEEDDFIPPIVTLLTAKRAVGTTAFLNHYDSGLQNSDLATVVFPLGQSLDSVVGYAIAPNDYVYTWFDDYQFSVGTSTDLDAYQPLQPYVLPCSKTPEDIVDIAIAPGPSNDPPGGGRGGPDGVLNPTAMKSSYKVYTFFKNHTRSKGVPNDLGVHEQDEYYDIGEYEIEDIVGIAIAPDTSRVFTWVSPGHGDDILNFYGEVIVGSSTDLNAYNAQHSAPYDYGSVKNAADSGNGACRYLKGMGIAKSTGRVYTLRGFKVDCPG